MKQHAEKCNYMDALGTCTCDGFHTFDELYGHRIALYITLCRYFLTTLVGTHSLIDSKLVKNVWRSKLHSDGSAFEGWFVLGIYYEKENQITYHLPMSKWDECDFAETLEKAPDFDGHTSDDVILRLQNL